MIPIAKVVFDPNFKQVTLTVGALRPNVSYRLTINGVKDFFDPVLIAPNTQKIFTYTAAPTLRGALALNHAPPHLQLEFNQGLTPLSANLSTHYAMLDITSGAGVSVTAANLALDRNYADNDRTVDPTTVAPLFEGHRYRITVNNIIDHEGHAIAADSTVDFGVPVDPVPPTAVSAHVTNPLLKRNALPVVFDEEIGPTSDGNRRQLSDQQWHPSGLRNAVRRSQDGGAIHLAAPGRRVSNNDRWHSRPQHRQESNDAECLELPSARQHH